MSRRDLLWRWLTATVWVHLVVSLVHGGSHAGAHVPLTLAANAFVLLVILAGPLIGLAVARRRDDAGCWIIALTLGASLLFGLVNHFMLVSPDHVMQVERTWRPLFASTAILVALTEAVGSGLALQLVRAGADSSDR